MSLLVGPAIGGLVVAAAAPPGAVVIDSGTYAVSVAALLWLSRTRRPTPDSLDPAKRAPMAGLWTQIVDGWRYVRRQPLLNAIMWTGAAYNLGSSMYDAIVVIFAVQTLHLSPAHVGLAVGLGGIGYPLGTVIATAATRRVGLGPALLWAAIPSVAGLFISAAAFGSRAAWFLTAGTAVVGLGQGCFAVNAITIRHFAAAADFRARATAVHRFASWGTLPVGSLLAGLVSEVFSVGVAMLAAAACACLCAWPLLASPLRSACGADDIALPTPAGSRR